jgi:hypothetical protein
MAFGDSPVVALVEQDGAHEPADGAEHGAHESLHFLRTVDPVTSLAPATTSQISVYVLDGQVGTFRHALESVSAVR